MLLSPWYRRLIGAESIDRKYSDASVAMICRFVAEHHGADPMWMRGVRPRLPFNWGAFPARAAITSLSELSDYVAEHKSGRLIPTLFEHYALISAEVLAFNVDSDFADVEAGLICVDLLKAPKRKLARFMGPWQSKRFELLQDFLFYSPIISALSPDLSIYRNRPAA